MFGKSKPKVFEANQLRQVNKYIDPINRPTTEVDNSITAYKTFAYRDVNAYLRNDGQLNPASSTLRHIENLDTALDGVTVKKDLVAYRSIEPSGMSSFLGVDDITAMNPNELTGKVVQDKGFTSASLIEKGAFGVISSGEKYMLEITSPKGTSVEATASSIAVSAAALVQMERQALESSLRQPVTSQFLRGCSEYRILRIPLL